MKNLLAFDIETTGLDYCQHDIVSLALVPIDGAQREKFGILELYHEPFCGLYAWDDWARNNFEEHIRDTWEDEKIDSATLATRLESYIEKFDDGHPGSDKVTLVGHNVGSFDIPFLKALYTHYIQNLFPASTQLFPTAISYRSVDTHSLLYSLYARGHIPADACSSSGAFKFFGIEVPQGRRHTAGGDAIATAELYKRIIEFEEPETSCPCDCNYCQFCTENL